MAVVFLLDSGRNFDNDARHCGLDWPAVHGATAPAAISNRVLKIKSTLFDPFANTFISIGKKKIEARVLKVAH